MGTLHQYFIAALVGKHVPRGGARVLDLGIREGRNLYYYPPDTVQVVAVSPKPDLQLLESQCAHLLPKPSLNSIIFDSVN